ncbi:hypothetical protein KCP74_18225 [Salmonella enterica subsp. enterica]|nr:hypothetical protein KCP74_18225 [Salmonella enterica subsp. enterica]
MPSELPSSRSHGADAERRWEAALILIIPLDIESRCGVHSSLHAEEAMRHRMNITTNTVSSA